MATRDFSQLDPVEVKAYSYIHDMSAFFQITPPGTSAYTPVVKALANHILVCGNSNLSYDRSVLCFKDGTLGVKTHLSTNASGLPGGATSASTIEHSEVLIGWNNSATPYGLNLRQGGVARNINNSAALAGIIPSNPNTAAGYGWIAINNAGITPTQETVLYEDARFLVGVSAENTTSPSVTAPVAAPVCTPANTGGSLVTATGTLDIAYAWVTRLNSRRSGHGITTPSPTQVGVTIPGGGTGTAGSVAVAIPAAPANVVGYVVYACQPTGGTLRVVGGGIATAAGQTHTIKVQMTQLAMANRFFNFSATQIQAGVIGTIENASPFTYGTARNVTSGYVGALWSPYFKDPGQLYCMYTTYNTSNSLKADFYDILGGGVPVNTTTTADGVPAFINHASGPIAGGSPIFYKSLPELIAYAVGFAPTESAGVVSAPGFVQIRSCLTNEILTSFVTEELTMYTQTAVSAGAFFDFEPDPSDTGATKSVDILIASRKHRGVIRKPVICWS